MSPTGQQQSGVSPTCQQQSRVFLTGQQQSGVDLTYNSKVKPALEFLQGKLLHDHLLAHIINPRRACAARVTVCHSVFLSVCYHVFCHYAQQGGQKTIPTGSVPHWLDFKNGDFRKSTAFKSYGSKPKRTSQYANEHGLPRPAVSEHGGGSTRNTEGEYVVLVCQKHYLPT